MSDINNSGVTRKNPRHHYSNRLEQYAGREGSSYQTGQPTITCAGKPRSIPNHQQKVDRRDFHRNMGGGSEAHAFPGRRK